MSLLDSRLCGSDDPYELLKVIPAKAGIQESLPVNSHFKKLGMPIRITIFYMNYEKYEFVLCIEAS